MSSLQQTVPPCGASHAPTPTATASSNKNEIKVSAEGVAKLTFNFLDELQGDSSLEPGEVKTPPRASSPAVIRNLPVPKAMEVVHSAAEIMAERKELSLKPLHKSASQLEAEVCEEKVRAILELDAIKRRAEAEKRKEQMEKRRQSGELDEEEESKRKAKEERKRLKRLKKEQKAARKALLSDQEEGALLDDSDDKDEEVLKTKNKLKRSKELEGYTSGHASPERADELRAAINTVAVPTGPRYPVMGMQVPPGHLPPPYAEAFMGFRPMNPFMRGARPDFHHPRGGFIPRGRGGMRGGMRFPGFRPPYFNPGVPPRHHMPMLRPHTPPPARGHSPIKAPDSNLKWTKVKPSISFAFNIISKLEQKLDETTAPSTEKSAKSKEKAHRSKSKQRKKLKKQKERTKVKKRRSSRNSSEKSSKRKIEKIRKSMKRPERKHSISIEYPKVAEPVKEPQEPADQRPVCAEPIVSPQEMWDAVENIKREKVDTVNEITLPLQLIKPVVKSESGSQNACKVEGHAADAEESKTACADNLDEPIKEKVVDMFAESPPRKQKFTTQDIEMMLMAARRAAATVREATVDENWSDSKSEQSKDKAVMESETKTLTPPRINLQHKRSATPPTPPLEHLNKPPEKTQLQKAIEEQRRINKMLRDDDLKLEMLQATEEKLMQRTRKYVRGGETPPPKAYKKDNKDKVNDKKNYKDKEKEKEKEKEREQEKAKNKEKEKPQRSLTPEIPATKHRNPFKRSVSRDRFFGKLDSSVGRERDRDKFKRNQSSVERGRNVTQRSRQRSLNRSHSRERGGNFSRRHSRSSTKDSKGSNSKLNRSRSGDNDAKNARVHAERDNRSTNSSLNRSFSGEKDGRGTGSKINRSHSGSRGSLNRSRSIEKHARGSRVSLNRSDSGDRDHDSKARSRLSKSPRHAPSKLKEQSKAFDTKAAQIPVTPPLERGTQSYADKEKAKVTTPKKAAQKKKRSMPLSFTAAEFLFPEDEDADESYGFDGKLTTPKSTPVEDEDTVSSSIKAKLYSQVTTQGDKDDSPDTDDYMDNWENDDVDLDVNSNTACEPTTPLRLSRETISEDLLVSRFVNPSPPAELLLKRKQENVESNTPTTSPPVEKIKVEADEPQTPPMTQVKQQLFGMQELYDEFIKSVEGAGVDVSAMQPLPPIQEANNEHDEELLSASSTSTSSSSSSSSSDASNSSSSSSSASSSSASSSDDSNDADSFQKPSPAQKPSPQEQILNIVIKTEKLDETPVPQPERIATPIAQPVPQSVQAAAEPSKPLAPPMAMLTLERDPTQPAAPAKAQKSDVARDFKKLKSLEANLSRIQMMRANYDSADEISEELLKMERLFLQEKNLILQKYAKAAPTSSELLQPAPTPPPAQFVQTLQQAATEANGTPPMSNKIFDANREAIKLTISPLKLPPTPAIFDKISVKDEGEVRHKRNEEPEESDFTEKLVKPAKEIAIVKPMMESKDSRSSQQRQHQRSPASSLQSHSSHERHRRARGRSLSASPRRTSRHPPSPQRRGGYATQQRYRGARRSHSRSPLRQTSNRPSSPPSHRRRRPDAATKHGYRKGQRGLRDSRSRSPHSPRSPAAGRQHSPRPHSPRSPPPPTRRRSYSRDRFSRSPLPFKPPSPPMRRSSSPPRRPSGVSPTRPSCSRRSRSHSRSPQRRPRSPRSPPSSRYDDHRRRRHSRSPTPQQHQYYGRDAHSPGVVSNTSSSYYYNMSPNRISLDARINIVLNGPSAANQDTVDVSYESYSSNYTQYGGAAYMPVPPEAGNYYANQYVPMTGAPPHSNAGPNSHAPPQQVYSNIPTIGGGHAPPSNFYYNEFGGQLPPPTHMAQHHMHSGQAASSSSVLKELPKAVAVQKGNVLEIVPSSELSSGVSVGGSSKSSPEAQKKASKPKVKSAAIAWKEEINSRHVTTAVLRLSRENEGISRSILKQRTVDANAEAPPPKDEKTHKKKVYFEDGIFPDRESDNEDRQVIEAKIRSRMRRLRKTRGIILSAAGNLVAEKQRKRDSPKFDPALEKLPPPPPPTTMVPPHQEQPIYLRPPTPTPLLYFHFDAAVHSMYVSQLERAIPPRLLNPKCNPSNGGAPGASTPISAGSSSQSPSALTQSPVSAGNGGHAHSAKKDLGALAAINRTNRSEHSSPKPPVTAQRRESPAQQQQHHHTLKTLSPMEAIHHQPQQQHQQHQHHNPHTQSHHHHHHGDVSGPPPLPPTSTASPSMTKGTFQAITANSSPGSPHMGGVHPPPAVVQQRQASPIGFVGMRINNFMRLPPSPLAAQPPPMQHGAGGNIPVLGMRHTFNVPPPTMLLPPGHPHSQYGQPPPHTTNMPSGAVPSGLYNAPPLQHIHQRPPPPNYYMQQAAPTLPSAMAAATNKDGSPQAMIAPFNVKRT